MGRSIYRQFKIKTKSLGFTKAFAPLSIEASNQIIESLKPPYNPRHVISFVKQTVSIIFI
jgi:hypothetical protein